MIGSRKGFRGSETQACSGTVRIGSVKPASRATWPLSPATACIALPQAIGPRLVSSPVTRPFSILMPVTSVS